MAFQETNWWWYHHLSLQVTSKDVFKNTSSLDTLCFNLKIPRDKWNASSAVEYYGQSADPRKWRKLIFYLDVIGDTALADSVMECAEPLEGMCIYIFQFGIASSNIPQMTNSILQSVSQGVPKRHNRQEHVPLLLLTHMIMSRWFTENVFGVNYVLDS